MEEKLEEVIIGMSDKDKVELKPCKYFRNDGEYCGYINNRVDLYNVNCDFIDGVGMCGVDDYKRRLEERRKDDAVRNTSSGINHNNNNRKLI